MGTRSFLGDRLWTVCGVPVDPSNRWPEPREVLRLSSPNV
jgi:hypothetical protein